MGEVKKVAVDSPEAAELIGEEAKALLEEEIELLDGASAEFDQDLVNQGKLSPVFFGSALTNFGGDIPAAFPHHDDFTASAHVGPRGDRSDERRGFLRLCIQDPGEYEQSPPGPDRIYADLFRGI